MKKSVYLALIGVATAQELRLDVNYAQTLPCSLCIRGGYNYVYAVDTTNKDIIRDVPFPTEYGGKCALQKIDGTFTYDGTTAVDLTKETTSYSYKDMSIALSNCPAKSSICDTKYITLANKDAIELTLRASSLNNKLDSCHWLVKAQCDVPEITMASDYNGLNGDFSILITEWSLNTNKVAFEANGVEYLSKNEESVFIKDYNSYAPATLPEIKYTDKTTTKKIVFPADLVEKDIKNM